MYFLKMNLVGCGKLQFVPPSTEATLLPLLRYFRERGEKSLQQLVSGSSLGFVLFVSENSRFLIGTFFSRETTVEQ